MTDLIKRDDALAAIDMALNNATGDLFDCHAAICALPAVDPAAIRDDALREAIAKCQTVMETAKLYDSAAMAVGAAACREVILALIGEKK